jgi:hypothetical protein
MTRTTPATAALRPGSSVTGSTPTPTRRGGLAPRAKQALAVARRAAKTDHRPATCTSDLPAGLLGVEDGMAARLMRQLDVDPVAMRARLRPRAAS